MKTKFLPVVLIVFLAFMAVLLMGCTATLAPYAAPTPIPTPQVQPMMPVIVEQPAKENPADTLLAIGFVFFAFISGFSFAGAIFGLSLLHKIREMDKQREATQLNRTPQYTIERPSRQIVQQSKIMYAAFTDDGSMYAANSKSALKEMLISAGYSERRADYFVSMAQPMPH